MLPTLSQDANAGLIAYLAQYKSSPRPPVALPESIPMVYMNAGSHPDIVSRVWDELGADLPGECRLLVHGTPALVHCASGVVLAAALGTAYALRLPSSAVEAALAAGAKTTTKWSGGRVLDVQQELGQDWILGSYEKAEVTWCREAYEALSV